MTRSGRGPRSLALRAADVVAPATSELPRGRARAVRAALGLITFGWAVYVLYVLAAPHLHLGLDELFKTWVFSGLVVAAGVLCLARAALVEEDRAVWIVFGAGVLLWASGSVAWSAFYAALEEPPYPSVADALYVGFYPAAYIAMMILVRRHVRSFPPSVWLDGLIGVLAVAAFGAEIVVPHLVGDTGGSLAVVATNLAYPLGDLLLIALLTGVFALAGWRPGRAWMLIAMAFVVLNVADTMYLYRVANGTFVEGTWLDAIWPAGMVLLSIAAWQRGRDTNETKVEGLAVLVAPCLFMFASLFVLIWAQTHEVNVYARFLADGALFAGLMRMIISFNEVRALAETRRQATTDELTGLANRRGLANALDRALIDVEDAQAAPVSLIVADLDGFKELNDTLGHFAGDLLLQMLGPRIAPLLDETATMARLGGDEFAVLLPGRDTPAAVELVEAIQRALEEPFTVRELNIHIEASVGISTYPVHGKDAEALMQRADVAMYQAKLSRTACEVYAPERDVHSLDRLSLLGELRRAIESNELVLHYQPKGDIATGRVTGVEALVRWEHPERGLLQPGDFLPMAEQTALMRPLTLWVLRTAMAQCRAWADDDIDLSVAINLAVPNLLDLRLPEDVARLLAEFMLPPSKLQFEVTENIVMSDPPRVLRVLQSLSGLGVGLSLDDFGTGSASLAYLKELPIDELKIDRSFVMNLEYEHTDAVIVQSTTELGRRLGLRVVAEGVESAAAWSRLSSMGCELAQGFWLLKPVPADSLREWLLRQSGERAVEHSTGTQDSALPAAWPS